VIWTIRWSNANDAITPQMRLSYDGQVYQIIAVQNIGIREYIQIITELRGTGVGAAPVACDPATYSNGGAFTQEIAAGGSYTAPAITITDVSGATRSSLPNIAVVCAWAVLSIRNSATDQLATIASYPSGGVLVLSDQTITITDINKHALTSVTIPACSDSIELPDMEVTGDNASSFTLPARLQIRIDNAEVTDAEILGDYINITVPTGGSCDPATYQNSDGSYTQEIASGATFTSANIVVTDINGVGRSVPSNINITALWATLLAKNSLGATLATVASYPIDGNIAIPDQSIDLIASDAYVLRSLTQVVGADVESNDIEVTDDGAFTQDIAARGGVRIVGSTIVSAAVNGDYIDITVPTPATPSGIAYKCTNPTGNISQRTGDCVDRYNNGEYDRTMPAYPVSYAELDYQATQADVRAVPSTGTLSTDLVSPTILKFNNSFGNKFRYTDDIGNPSDAAVGSNLWAHVNWNQHSWTGATAGVVIDHLHDIEMDVDYLEIGGKYALSSGEPFGQSWNDWIDDIVALGTHKGRTGWRPLDVAFAFSGAHAAKCEPDLVWADEFFDAQRVDNRCGMMTGETSDTNQYLYVVDSSSADMLHNATIGSDLGFQSDITNVFIIRNRG
jgi:hypothetical protein